MGLKNHLSCKECEGTRAPAGVIFSLSVLTLVSCKNNNNESGVEIAPTEENIPEVKKAERIQRENENEGVLRTQDMTALYKELNMTEEQVKRFQDDYRQKLNNRSSDNIVDHNLIDLQMDESLKEVLSAEQYASYQDWKKRNPSEK